jgi:excisionase family DNA binding protein
MMTDTEPQVTEVAPLALSIRGVAKVLDISVRSAHRLVEDGELESIHVGKARVTMRVPYASVQRYVDQMRAENPYVRSKQ